LQLESEQGQLTTKPHVPVFHTVSKKSIHNEKKSRTLGGGKEGIERELLEVPSWTVF
jgi:hypothetical protein